jgi:6,7-dimethyl-8-ribityllumazine synthase
MTRIALVCARYHRENVELMLEVAKNRAQDFGIEVAEIIWVPGSMEIPLAIKGLISRDDIDGAACLGIIEKGETQHGLVMGQAVVKTILELQLEFDKPIGLGIIGPGAEPEHVEPRLAPHASGAIDAIAAVL